jgi:hypothetical protein
MEQDDTVKIGLGTRVEFWACEFCIVMAAAIDAFVLRAASLVSIHGFLASTRAIAFFVQLPTQTNVFKRLNDTSQ